MDYSVKAEGRVWLTGVVAALLVQLFIDGQRTAA